MRRRINHSAPDPIVTPTIGQEAELAKQNSLALTETGSQFHGTSRIQVANKAESKSSFSGAFEKRGVCNQSEPPEGGSSNSNLMIVDQAAINAGFDLRR